MSLGGWARRLKALGEYSRSVYRRYKEEVPEASGCRMGLTYFPGAANAVTVAVGRPGRRKYGVVINLWYFCCKVEEPGKQRFYLCTAIAHELEHIRLLENHPRGVCATYRELLVEMETVIHTARHRLLQILISRAGRKCGSLSREYYSSMTELMCMSQGYRRALADDLSELSSQDVETLQRVWEAIEFVADHLEIMYSERGAPVNKFQYCVTKIQRRLQKVPSLLETCPALAPFFDVHGGLMPLEAIFDRQLEEPGELYQEFLVRFFLGHDKDYTVLFLRRPELKVRLEEYLNEYSKACLRYMSDLALGGVLLPEEVLRDNTGMVVRVAGTMRRVMADYGMTQLGGIIPVK